MDIPQKIKDKIVELQAREARLEEEKRNIEEAKRKRRERIELLRSSRRGELEESAKEITDWLREFDKSGCRRLLALRPSIIIFRARFWKGEPISESFLGMGAVVELKRSGRLDYYEYHNSAIGRGVFNWTYLGEMDTIYRFVDPFTALYSHLVADLHPDFVARFAEAIKTGKVWDYIDESLK